MIQVTAITIYPVKSLRGITVTEAHLDELGFVGDRRFLVVGPDGKFLTQRTLPAMARISTHLGPATLALKTDGRSPMEVPRAPQQGSALLPVTIWGSEGLLAEDCGVQAAEWLTQVLGTEARLVRIGPAFERPLKPDKARPGDCVAFTDAYPFMITSEESLGDLNTHLVAAGSPPVPMDRFRASLVISGAGAFAEDTWTRIRIGDVILRAGGPCARCPVTTTDQQTGERSHEPLRTLATYRRDPVQPSRINFGHNFIHESKTGILRVGDPVIPL